MEIHGVHDRFDLLRAARELLEAVANDQVGEISADGTVLLALSGSEIDAH